MTTITERIGYFTQDRGETFHEGMISDLLYSRQGKSFREAQIRRSTDGGLTYRPGETVNLDGNLPILWGGKFKEGHPSGKKS